MNKLNVRYVAVTRRVIVTEKVASSSDKRGNIYHVIGRRMDSETVHVAVRRKKGGL